MSKSNLSRQEKHRAFEQSHNITHTGLTKLEDGLRQQFSDMMNSGTIPGKQLKQIFGVTSLSVLSTLANGGSGPAHIADKISDYLNNMATTDEPETSLG